MAIYRILEPYRVAHPWPWVPGFSLCSTLVGLQCYCQELIEFLANEKE